MTLTLILGDQLHRDWFQTSPLQLGTDSRVLMIEDLAVAATYRYHKLRLLHTFVAMRSFCDALREQGVAVRYFELPASAGVSFWQRLALELADGQQGQERELRVAAIADASFEAALLRFCQQQAVALTVLPSPAFLESAADSQSWFAAQRRPRMASFYQRQRRRLGLLLEADGTPTGGRWSFDAENRRRLPKDYREPRLPALVASPHEPVVRQLIASHFADHPGELGPLWIPFDHAGADAWLKQFLAERLDDFGPYEDAISQHHDSLHHSLLSPLLNIGLLTPAAVLAATMAYATSRQDGTQLQDSQPPSPQSIPIASLEGFLRQLIGWREFVRGIDRAHGERQASSNFWNHQRQLAPCWNDGSSGLPPLDTAIKRVNRLGYNHHIERLMVISNLMLLCEIEPREVHRWFMERYLDSYEWVMGPNVYGMGQMSDGGIFATKPYICGSNYILKMGDYKRGPWCEIWDGLYWRFVDRHRDFFRANPRLSMMVSLLERIEPERRQSLAAAAETFLERATMVRS